MSLNATSASSAIFYKYSSQELYAGTDFSALNWAERQWVSWYLLIGDPVIATGLASFLLHEVCIRVIIRSWPSLINTTLGRPSTLGVASPGSSLTPSLTFVGGSFSQIKFPRPRINGSAQRVYSSPISPYNSLWYAVKFCPGLPVF
jgi:hypothetical protein